MTIRSGVATASPTRPALSAASLVDLDQDRRAVAVFGVCTAGTFPLSGDRESAIAHYRTAAARTTSCAERDYLMAQAAGLSPPATPA